MKRYLSTAAILLLAVVSCTHDLPTGNVATPPKVLDDPELTLSGAPKEIASGESFDLTISTLSPGALTLTVSNASVAFPTKKSDTEYSIAVMSLDDASFKITVNQEEMKKEGYASAKKTVTVKVIGSGPVEIPGPDDEVEGTAVSYVEAAGDVLNPERGLYHAHEIYADTPMLTGSEVEYYVKTGHKLILLEFYLTEYMAGSIYQSELDRIQQFFDAIRDGGAKAIVRFAYRNTNENYQTIVQEPALDIVLKHIEQLKPILQRNEDVLFALQAGFIGSWGEWYYTTNISSTADRKKVTDALLDAVPTSRQIQLRTPMYKMDMYDYALADTLTAATAHDGSVKSRLAGHNDCFVASADDQGTFKNETTRQYWKAETRYMIMGGETCDPLKDENYIYCECENTLKDLEDYHWTYLHDGYFAGILNRWKTEGCFDEIQARLGYRLVLKDVHYGAIEAGKPCQVTIRLYNKGFAAPMNPRQAFLVWETPDGKTEQTPLGADPRTWQPGYNGAVGTFVPSTAEGTLYLKLSDPLLPDNPAYSIALANADVFDAGSGMNKLFEIK